MVAYLLLRLQPMREYRNNTTPDDCGRDVNKDF